MKFKKCKLNDYVKCVDKTHRAYRLSGRIIEIKSNSVVVKFGHFDNTIYTFNSGQLEPDT